MVSSVRSEKGLTMSDLQGKRVVVGITGGIAAYKTIELIRLLRKADAEVRVVLTPAAAEFVTPLTLQAISGNPVSQSLLDPSAELSMGHIELAKWADIVVVAPATADSIARMTVGMANDLLSTLCLATAAPILLAPAMNQQMYAQTVTQENIAKLIQRGVKFIGPNSGAQACGDVGAGRMSEPAEIFTALCEHFSIKKDLLGLTVVITAGPTQEAIDPVRYISNHSSGKMGYAIAQAFADRGAEVTLISGPVNLPTPAHVNRINVISAQEMWQVAMESAVKNQLFIGCAAVADYRMAEISTQKIKKTGDNDELTLRLVKNPDIIASVAAAYAKDKLQRKNLDMICANSVAGGAVFGEDQNALHLFWKDGEKLLPTCSKNKLAQGLVQEIVERFITR